MLTSQKQIPVVEIKSKLSADLPLEKYGDIGDFYKFPMTGDFYFDLVVTNPELFTFFVVMNNAMKEILLKKGDHKLFASLTGNESLVLIANSSEKNIGSVEIKSQSQTQQPPSNLTVCGIGDFNTDISNNKYLLSTNKGSGITTVSSFFFNDSSYLTNLSPDNKQASGLGLMNLPMGKYSAELNIFKSDLKNNDQLLLFDGLGEPLTIGNANDVETQKTINFDIPYGYIYLIAIDKLTTSGTTEFIISNLQKVGELDYFPPQQLPLTFSEFLGACSSNKSEAIITTGTGSRSTSTLVKVLGIDESLLAEFTEGSYGTWNLPNGKYRLTYQLKTSDKTNIDSSYVLNNGELAKLIATESATQAYSTSQNISDLMSTEFVISDGKLTILVVDKGDKVGTTEIKFTLLEFLGLINNDSNSNSDSNQDSNNDNSNNSDNTTNNSSDDNPVVEYLIDTLYGKNQQSVEFDLGGDITKKSFNLRLHENSQLNIELDSQLIIEIAQNNQKVYGTEYAEKLTIDLEMGEYELNLFTESSMSQSYQLSLNTL